MDSETLKKVPSLQIKGQKTEVNRRSKSQIEYCSHFMPKYAALKQGLSSV